MFYLGREFMTGSILSIWLSISSSFAIFVHVSLNILFTDCLQRFVEEISEKTCIIGGEF